MKKIIGYLTDYLHTTDKRVLFFSTLFTALAIFFNYRFGWNRLIRQQPSSLQYLSWYVLFLIAFGFAYWLPFFLHKTPQVTNKKFWLLLVLAPAVFAWKMVYALDIALTPDPLGNVYWTAVIYWPFKVTVVTGILFLIYRLVTGGDHFYGLTTKNFSARPYLFMLLLMVPLVALASTQPDFLAMYPRMQKIEYLQLPGNAWHKLLYQLSYGSDFFSIELFFRGFLVFAFAKYAGKAAILPMAIFYCTIHFGKPLGECISSYFGGIILGVVSFHTQTIYGGFLVHVGIAWLMELGGYLGQIYF